MRQDAFWSHDRLAAAFGHGIPALAILVGVLINGMQFSHAVAAINSRITSLESVATDRFASLEDRLAGVEPPLIC